MKVTYDYYRIFYYVAKYRSFTRAAKVLLNSQPNITRTINNLEDALNCRLFFRTRSGVTLTPEGEKLFVHVQVAMEHLQMGEQEIENSKRLVNGNLSIAVSEIALHTLVLKVLQDFHQKYPGVHIRMSNDLTHQAIEAVRSGEAELAVVTTPTGVQKPLSEMSLFPLKMVLVAGPNYQHFSGRKVKMEELANCSFITLGRKTETYMYLDSFFASCNMFFNPSIEAATTEQVLPLIKHDIGIGIIPYVLAKEAIEKKEVYEIMLEEKIPNRYVTLVWDKNRPMSTVAKTIINHICDVVENAK